jgi:hypothetical protein
MPMITRVQSKKEALAGVMRIAPEGTLGAWLVGSPFRIADFKTLDRKLGQATTLTNARKDTIVHPQ